MGFKVTPEENVAFFNTISPVAENTTAESFVLFYKLIFPSQIIMVMLRTSDRSIFTLFHF